MSAYKSQQKLNKGFTLVELLIAISLIAILTGVLLAILNPRGIQAKARDSQRVSDLSKVKVALENYFADNRSYPSSAWARVSSVSSLSPNYINVLPPDPKETGTLCDSSNVWRGYVYKSDGNRYVLATNMETTSMGGSCPFTVAADIITFCTSCGFSGGTAYFTTAD